MEAEAPQQIFSAALLAGGRSLRMGTDKAFLRVGGELLIERQLRRLRDAGAAEILLSGRTGVEYPANGTTVVYDKVPDAGPLAALTSVLQSASAELLLVLAVDMPAMTSAMLRRIVRNCDEHCGCVPVDAHGFQPLAAVYPRKVLPMAQGRLAEARYSMRSFVELAVASGSLKPMPIPKQEAVCFTNWNWPGDWHQD